MTADESLVTLNGLKKYDQKKGKAVIEANELPASPLNKVYNVGDDVYSKDVKLSTYQQMMDEVSKVKVDGNTQDANRNIISKAVIEQANIPPAPLDKVYNIGGSPIELTASGTCTHETSPGGTEPLTIENLEATGSGILPAAGTYTLTYTEDTDWTSKEITYRGLTFTAVKRYKIDDGLFEKAAFADSVTIDGTVHSNVINGEVFTGTGWVIIWNIWDEADNAYDGSIYLKDANATIPTVVSTVVSGLNGWQGSFSSIPEGTTEVTFNNDYTVGTALHPFPYGEHALYGAIDTRLKVFMVAGYNLPSPTATIVTPGSGLYMGDCFINHLPARSSFKLKSSIDNVWHTVSYPLPENGAFIYGTSLSEESCMVIRVNNQLRIITIDKTQGQAFTINYEEETSTRVFSKSVELITKNSADDLFIPQSEKGVASGVATLGADGKVPRSQLTVEAMEYKGKVYVNTTGVAELSALPNIGTVANATQHDVNVAIDSNALLSKVDPVGGGQTFSGDLNDLTTPGVYSIATSTGHLPSNLPRDTTLYGTAVIYKGKYGYITQEVSSATASRKWIRTKNEHGTWNVWVEVTEPKTVSLYLYTSDLGITADSTISIDTFIQKLWDYLTAMYPQHMGYFNVSGMMVWQDADNFYITDGRNTVSSSGSQFNFFVRYAPWSCNGGIFITAGIGTYTVKCKYLDTVSNIQQIISQLATS